jgi:hypothetical protein
MIGAPPWISQLQRREVPDGSVTPLDTPFNRKIHKEYASAMAQPRYVKTPEEYAAAMAAGQNAPRPYPTHYTAKEGGSWFNFNSHSIMFSDGSTYDCKLRAWRPAKVDPVQRWDQVCAEDPLASNKMVLAGNQMVDEIRKLRAKLLDMEQEKRRDFEEAANYRPDDEGDF